MLTNREIFFHALKQKIKKETLNETPQSCIDDAEYLDTM